MRPHAQARKTHCVTRRTWSLERDFVHAAGLGRKGRAQVFGLAAALAATLRSPLLGTALVSASLVSASLGRIPLRTALIATALGSLGGSIATLVTLVTFESLRTYWSLWPFRCLEFHPVCCIQVGLIC